MKPIRLISAIAVVDIDPDLTPLASRNQKWITSLELTSVNPETNAVIRPMASSFTDKPSLNSTQSIKFLRLAPSVWLIIGFCEQGYKPIRQIELASADIHSSNSEWLKVKWADTNLNRMENTLQKTHNQSELFSNETHINKTPTESTFVHRPFSERPFSVSYDLSASQNRALIQRNSLSPETSSISRIDLFYKVDDPQLAPLTDIQVLSGDKKHRQNRQIVYNIPEGYKVCGALEGNSLLIAKQARSQFEQIYRPILLEHHPPESAINLGMVPTFCFPDGMSLSKELKGFITFSFILTLTDGQRVYATCLCFKENLKPRHKQILGANLNEEIYSQKALCILSPFCFTDEFGQCLQHLYRLSVTKNSSPFSKVIHNFFEAMVLPGPIGAHGLVYSYGGCSIPFYFCKQFCSVSEKSMYFLVKFLSADTIVKTFEALLLERKVIFVSSSRILLGLALEAFLAILYPFCWEQVIISVLAPSIQDYITAPVPLVAGMGPNMVDPALFDQECFLVNLDSNDLADEEQLPPLPQKLEKQLRKRLSQYNYYSRQEVKDFLDNPESNFVFKMKEIDHPEFHGSAIREIFLQFTMALLKNYRKFMKGPMAKQFRTYDFLSDLGMAKAGSFGYKLTETMLFISFLERAFSVPQPAIANSTELPLTQDHLGYIQFFNKCLDTKKNKKGYFYRVQNERCIIALHPDVEDKDASYLYSQFPSILAEKILVEKILAKKISPASNPSNSVPSNCLSAQVDQKQVPKAQNFPTSATISAILQPPALRLTCDFIEWISMQLKLYGSLFSKFQPIDRNDAWLQDQLELSDQALTKYTTQLGRVESNFEGSNTNINRVGESNVYLANSSNRHMTIKPKQLLNMMFGLLMGKGRRQLLLTVDRLIEQSNDNQTVISQHRLIVGSKLFKILSDVCSWFLDYYYEIQMPLIRKLLIVSQHPKTHIGHSSDYYRVIAHRQYIAQQYGYKYSSQFTKPFIKGIQLQNTYNNTPIDSNSHPQTPKASKRNNSINSNRLMLSPIAPPGDQLSPKSDNNAMENSITLKDQISHNSHENGINNTYCTIVIDSLTTDSNNSILNPNNLLFISATFIIPHEAQPKRYIILNNNNTQTIHNNSQIINKTNIHRSNNNHLSLSNYYPINNYQLIQLTCHPSLLTTLMKLMPTNYSTLLRTIIDNQGHLHIQHLYQMDSN